MKESSKPLKWHGGKSYLADWVLSLMPPHVHYPDQKALDKTLESG